MVQKTVAVFGFSVLAGSDNVVFAAQEKLRGEDILLRRVALGAQNPANSSYLMDYVLDRTQPDAVIVEMATSGYNGSGDPAKLRAALRWMAHVCQQRGIALRFLNLPLRLPPDLKNWVGPTIRSFAQTHGFGLHAFQLRPGLLRDKVHVNAVGFPVYADVIAEEARMAASLPDQSKPIDITGFGRGFIPVTALLPGRPTRLVDRNGFIAPVVDVQEDEEVRLQAPDGSKLAGLVLATNDRSGVVQFQNTVSGVTGRLKLLNPRSYYERPVIHAFPWQAPSVTLRQLPGIPDVTFVKGEIAKGPRIASIMGAIYRTVPPHPSDRRALHVPIDLPPSPSMEAAQA